MIRAVGIVSKPKKEDICGIVPRLVETLHKRGLEVYADTETASCVSGGEFAPQHIVPRADLPSRVDLLLVLGGDGTLLATARALGEREVPILPVNLGQLGFLTSVTLQELYPVLEEVLEGRHRISERILLQTDVYRGGKLIHSHQALNEAVINKAALARIVDFDLEVDGNYVCSYKADGLIISTPTGSTGYSLSAGGPIVYPVVAAFVVTPICPHALTNRPLVIPDSLHLRVKFGEGEQSLFLTIDGQVGFELEHQDEIELRKAPRTLQLVRPQRKTYFEILRNKLKWGER